VYKVVWQRPGLTSLLLAPVPLRVAVVLPTGVTGLVNLGNTCYLNAVLQALAAVGCGEGAGPLSEQAAPVTAALRRLCLRTTTSPCQLRQSFADRSTVRPLLVQTTAEINRPASGGAYAPREFVAALGQRRGGATLSSAQQVRPRRITKVEAHAPIC